MTEKELADLKAAEPELVRQGWRDGDFWMVDLYVTRAMCRRGVSPDEAKFEYRQFEKSVKAPKTLMQRLRSWVSPVGGSQLLRAVRLGRTPWVKSGDLPKHQQKSPMELYAACIEKVTNDG